MARIALLGAAGRLGRVLAAELAADGHELVALGRDPERTQRVLRAVGVVPAAIRAADASDPDSVGRAVIGGPPATVLVVATGPLATASRGLVDLAIGRGWDLFDTCAAQDHVGWVHAARDAAARDAGVRVVPAAGFEGIPGDLLAHLAAQRVGRPTDVHVAVTFPSPGGRVGTAPPGWRRAAARLLDGPGQALVRGELVEERIAEERRLAWFPRPIGPRHAAGYPGPEVVTVPRHVPGVRTVRTYLAVAGWRAEALQSLHNAARWGPVRRRAQAWVARERPEVSDDVRRQVRWGIVAEAAGDDGVARAWAAGHDPDRTGALALAELVQAVLAGRSDVGVLAPSLVDVPGEVLDRIAARSDLRWSRTGPSEDLTVDPPGG
jgi:short subunit dehydrogenase-like uncharacterized protein